MTLYVTIMETRAFLFIHLHVTHYSYSEAVNILLATEHDKICTKHPTLVEDNLSFVIDLSKLAHTDDIKSDNCAWPLGS